MALLTVHTVDRTTNNSYEGLQASAAGGGDAYPNTGLEYVLFDATDGSATITVTLHIQTEVDGQTVTNPTFVMQPTTDRIIGPFPPSIYNDTNGRMNFTYSAVTGLKVGVFINSTS